VRVKRFIPKEFAVVLQRAAMIINGKAVAAEVEAEVRQELVTLGFAAGLTVIRVGNDPASEVYVRNKARKARELGLRGEELIFPETLTETALLAEIQRLNDDNDVDGILVQLPLPKHIDSKKVITAIDPRKDVDGFHPMNVGLLHLGQPSLVPCTPAGVMRLIASTGTKVEGARAVVIGRSDIVGKPVAALLLRENATVTICHSRTRDLPAVAREADVLVAAIGKPRFVKTNMVKRGAVVIDVGINRVDGKLAGDVDFQSVRDVASWITPVPGGVGPMTIAMLMSNTVTAAKVRRR
jgi:methylenetetrahydrofolate dehydrogenase (NADP+) / methenyltetrahydrofolate cyclohydrolase